MEALLPNITIFGSAVVFLIAYGALKRLLFLPYLALLEKRDQATGNDHGNLDTLMAQTQELQTQIDAALQTAQKQARTTREELLLATEKETNALVLQAQSAAKEHLTNAGKELVAAKQKMLDQLRSELPQLTKTASQKMMPF